MDQHNEGRLIPLKQIRLIALIAALSLLFSAAFSMSVSAGEKVVITNPVNSDDEGLNEADWNISDYGIERMGNTIVISADDASSDTKIISKTNAKKNEDVSVMAEVTASVKFTALPAGERFAFALGLMSIESGIGEDGNIELYFKNEGGIKAGVEAFSGDDTATLLAPKGCGVALNSNATIKMVLFTKGNLQVFVNGALLGNFDLPISGEGRFGIIQTGSCGAVISNLSYTCYYYETPENTDIFEDFEKGEFNANLFVSSSNDNGIFPSGVMIEDYNGSKVLRFRNTKLAHFCTLYQYSNFEISFDIPYISRQFFYDEYGNVTGKPCSHLAVGFGEETSTPVGYSYVSDVDLVCFTPSLVRSELLKAFRVEIKNMGITDLSTNEGYSVKLRVVDGHYDVSVKSLKATEYKTIASVDIEAQRSGYVNIWSSGDGDFAIDNLRITNLDRNANKIDVEYKSSLLKAEDYVPTKEENEKKFRPEDSSVANILGSKYFVLGICLVAAAVIICGGGLTFYIIRKKKTGGKDEND